MRPSLPLAISVLLLTACAHGRRPASYLPVGAPAQYGDRTADGIALLLAAPDTVVFMAVTRALTSNGYGLERVSSRQLRSAPRAIGGDSSVLAQVDIIPEDRSGGGVVAVVSGEFDLPSAGIRRARVVQRPGERSPLYARLRQVADSVRRFAAPR